MEKEESELKQEQFAALALDSGIYFASKEWEILLNLFPQSGVNSDRETIWIASSFIFSSSYLIQPVDFKQVWWCLILRQS